MRPQRTPNKPRRAGQRHFGAAKDPVEVCGRIRNLTSRNQESCIEAVNDTTLRLNGPPPENKVIECKFYKVFSQNISQKQLFDYVANPMVDDLIKGKNGLLFTYGVTSSGKTYTMTGTLLEPGLLPRCLDMLFNSITTVQASKYVFIPDVMNGFSVQSEADAMLEKQERDILPKFTPKTPKTPSRPRKAPDLRYDLEHCQSENINPDCRYAVFVSYVEIYNDYIYDLLGDAQLDAYNRPKAPQTKRLREDRHKNMFVYGVQQVEVKTTEEAFAAFQQGSERRRIAHTQLNAESSRSHSILTIRLVQAPLDPLGEDLLQEKNLICVSQMSLVDLAGSERMGRTGAGGERVREAGNINGSLMTLRRCLEQLRENQKTGSTDMVKYRNSKLTHLFKSYFEGHGKIRMVVCLNPNPQEFDENVHVTQFAEMAQQVEVARSEEYKVDRESLKRRALEARAKAEEERKRQNTAMQQLNKEASGHRLFQKSRTRRTPSTTSESDATAVTSYNNDEVESDWDGINFNLGPNFPNLEVADAFDEDTIPSVISFLEDRILGIKNVRRPTASLGGILRGNMTKNGKSDKQLHERLHECENELTSKNKEVLKLERQVKKLESKNQVLTRTTQVFEKDKMQLQDDLNQAEMQLKNSHMETRKIETKLKGAVANTKAHIEKQCDKRVRNMQTEMQEKMWVKEERLRQLKNIISDGRTTPKAPVSEWREGRSTARRPPVSTPTSSSNEGTSRQRMHKRRSRSAENLLSTTSSRKSVSNRPRLPSSTSDHDLRSRPAKKVQPPPQQPAPPVAAKHRRSISTSNNNWLAHLPSSTIRTETILQPNIRPNKVVNVPSPKDVASANKYLLTHQREDKDGEIETQLVKGEVFQTRTGGQQVQFVDIETLKQHDPVKATTKSPTRKRQSSTSVDNLSAGEQSSWTDVETRCAYGIGNHPKSISKRKK